jgi:glycosyltransferase involved in cell wall biosynthesis
MTERTVDHRNSREYQLLVDISSRVIYQSPTTGIPRVVDNVLREMLVHPPTGYRVEPVYVNQDGDLYYARQFSRKYGMADEPCQSDSLVRVGPNDIFYTADTFYNCPFKVFDAIRAQRVRIIFTVHDLIPLTHPHLVTKSLRLRFRDWLHNVLRVADGVVCPTEAVSQELREWIRRHPEARTDPLPIWSIHLGADMATVTDTAHESRKDSALFQALQRRSTLLMVGTVELRKGQAFVLKAVETLWRSGLDVNLVIVGRQGMLSNAMKLRRHPENGKRLFWRNDAPDALLVKLYQRSTVLIAASVVEGFGLPLIEAAQYGLPIIARDIPVFREVAGDSAYYFAGNDVKDLAEAIEHWFRLYREGKSPSSTSLPWLSWQQSVARLYAAVIPRSDQISSKRLFDGR